MAALTIALGSEVMEQGLTEHERLHLEGQFKAECARCGLTICDGVHIEAQANWFTGGADVTATAFVEQGARRPRNQQVCRKPTAPERARHEVRLTA